MRRSELHTHPPPAAGWERKGKETAGLALLTHPQPTTHRPPAGGGASVISSERKNRFA